MNPDRLKVAVIVDNPFRDLEGAALVARELVKRGAVACLVPMYEQAYDVPSFRPNVVLANYVRANNKPLLASYRASGAAIVIMDTEGNGGEDPLAYADSVLAEQPEVLVDAYCLWGKDQYDAFVERAVLPNSALALTGVPRYDLFSSKWERYRSPQTPESTNYVLINTNFPIVNPRFDQDTESVVQAWIRAGISEKYSRDYANDAIPLHRKYMDVVEEVLRRFPRVQFVLRPHPFEKIEFYQYLQDFPNCKVIQAGTSLDWVRGCVALLHLNCATSIEAVMLQREVISFEWINTRVARQQIATDVSRQSSSLDDLCAQLASVLSGSANSPSEQVLKSREKYIARRYEIDGNAAARVADLCIIYGQKHTWGKKRSGGKWSLKEIARKALGYKGFTWLQERSGGIGRTQRKGKGFSGEQVSSIIGRLNEAADEVVHCNVLSQSEPGRSFSWSTSGASVVVHAKSGQ